MAVGPFKRKKKPATPEEPEPAEETVPDVPNTTASASSAALQATAEAIKRRRKAAAGTTFGRTVGLIGSAMQRGIGRVQGTTTLIGK